MKIDMIERLVKKSFDHKPETNQVYYLSFSEKKIIRIIKFLQDKKNWSDQKIKSLFLKKKSNEIDDLKLLGILVQENILEINNVKISEMKKDDIRKEIYDNWSKYEKIFTTYNTTRDNILAGDQLVFDARKLLIYKDSDL